MATQIAVKCPACGSSNVDRIPLFLISTRYFKCGACVATFRDMARECEEVDTSRLDAEALFPHAGKKS
jgi:ribosomal protein L37AE/L43A